MQDYTDQSNPYASPYSVATQSVDARAQFIKKTYTHLAGAIAAFALIEYLLFQIPGIENTVGLMMGGRFSWMIVLAAFMGVSFLANKWAMSNTSKTTQYIGLGVYVVAQAIITLPMLLIAASLTPQTIAAGAKTGIIFNAGMITIAMVVGLTVIAFTSKKDFSFLDGFLKIGGLVAIGAIVLSMVFGFSLGIFFSALMVIFASASILRETGKIMYQYNTNQYVAASLGLFASVALLFWYVLRILISIASSD